MNSKERSKSYQRPVYVKTEPNTAQINLNTHKRNLVSPHPRNNLVKDKIENERDYNKNKGVKDKNEKDKKYNITVFSSVDNKKMNDNNNGKIEIINTDINTSGYRRVSLNDDKNENKRKYSLTNKDNKNIKYNKENKTEKEKKEITQMNNKRSHITSLI